MVITYHLIFTTYGFWLPNDPRGSGSDFVRAWELFLHGQATKVSTRHSVAGTPHDRQLRGAQKSALQYDPVVFTPQQIECVGRAFARVVDESKYQLLACSIMPQHVHQVVARHANRAEQIIGHFKARGTQQLVADNLHPFLDQRHKGGKIPPAWASRGWTVFLNTEEDVLRSVRYVEQNPIKQGLPRQRWPFVTPV